MRRTGTLLLVLLVAMAVPATGNAGLINADFSSSFDGWMGDLDNGSGSLIPLDPPPGPFSANYAIGPPGNAVLATTPGDVFFLTLFQGFMVGTPATGERLVLSYDVNASISSGGMGGLALAQLTFPGGIFSLLGSGVLDITALAGQPVELLFGLADFDDSADSLAIGNLGISSTQVPEPGSLGLLWFGAAVLAFARPRTS